MANCEAVLTNLAAWIRRQLRAKQLALSRKPQQLMRRLRQVGWQRDLLKMGMTSWHTSRSSYASIAISNSSLAELGLYDLASIATGVFPGIH